MTIPKFRAWFKQGSKMVNVATIDFLEKELKSHANVMYSFDEIELMQSTGLFDVDGMEIFEGDIVKLCFEEDGLFEICLDTVGGFYTKSVLTGKIQFLEVSDFDELETAKEVFNEYVEIVGNIWEDGELLDS